MVQLNQRQLDVLRWIGDGCPDRDWPDQSHKLTARSLAGKGLADVRRKNGYDGFFWTHHDGLFWLHPNGNWRSDVAPVRTISEKKDQLSGGASSSRHGHPPGRGGANSRRPGGATWKRPNHKKKIWTATITAAGRYYLEHGKPPPSREFDFELTAN